MEKKGGVYYVPCTINGLKLKFIFDTGAGDVTISLSEAIFMIKNGYMNEEDLVGTEYYRIANGEISEGTKIIIREFKIGDRILRNVKASIVHTSSAPLLLGQSAIERFGRFSVDYATNTLYLGGTNATTNWQNSQSINQVNKNLPSKKVVEKPNSNNTISNPTILKNDSAHLISVIKHEEFCRIPAPLPIYITQTMKNCSQLYLEGKYEECEMAYDSLIEKYPDYCFGYYNRGLARFNGGNKIGAESDYRKAYSLSYLEAKELLIKHFGYLE